MKAGALGGDAVRALGGARGGRWVYVVNPSPGYPPSHSGLDAPQISLSAPPCACDWLGRG